MEQLISLLGQELELNSREIADVIWLAIHMQAGERASSRIEPEPASPNQPGETRSNPRSERFTPPNPQPPVTERSAALHAPDPIDKPSSGSQLTLQLPDARSLREPLQLARSLKPLLQKVAAGSSNVLDEEATIQRLADEQIWIPVVKPKLEPWLDLALVVDESVSMQIWQRTIGELQRLFAHYGVFRDVRVWGLAIEDGKVSVRPGLGTSARRQSRRDPKELLDPSGRRLILVATDCVSAAWRSGEILPALKLWAQTGTLAIVQMLPEWLWARTGLGLAAGVRFSSLTPGAANQQLLTQDLSAWDEIDLETGIKVPVVTLEPERFKTWAQMIAARGIWSPGVVFEPEPLPAIDFPAEDDNRSANTPTDAVRRVQRFRATASPMARRLAGFLASAPAINLPVVRILQDRLLPDSQQVHVAEVFLGGLLKPLVEIQLDTKADTVPYDFMDGVRSVLLESVPTSDVVNILSEVSTFVAERLGLTVDDFIGVLRNPQVNGEVASQSRSFALVTAEILQQLGGEYARFAEELVAVNRKSPVVTPPTPGLLPLKVIEFTSVKVDSTGKIVAKPQHTAETFTEDLGNGVSLTMVKIPAGEFMMGSPESEAGRSESESPQHRVRVPEFYMGQTLVTQAQWRQMMGNNPSYFKGEAKLPVEQVSWQEAMEFCQKLSQRTKREYRLPSEAEWEYVARAGTTTPFSCGETITTEIANYNGDYTYANAPKGVYRKKTTPVDSFPPNPVGLYDIHGNLWEWCLDPGHHNYQGAPTDGSAWIEGKSNSSPILRGGSWNALPRLCRSATRSDLTPDFRNRDIGFRVVCETPRTL